MSDKHEPQSNLDKPIVYQIKVKGHLDHHWSSLLENTTITATEGNETLLSGSVVDEAALYALLRRIRDLGLQLLSFTRLESD